jgi:hypothetical protein
LTIELAPSAEYKTKDEKPEPIVEKESEEVEVIGGSDTLTLKKEKIIVMN